MEVSEKDQHEVRNGIQSLESIIKKWYKFEKIDRYEMKEAFDQLKRIDMVCKDGNT